MGVRMILKEELAMCSIGRAMMFYCVAAAIALGCCMAEVRAQVQGADSLILRAPEGGNVRALIIGIDNYQHYRSLKGAVADARDIEGALRRVGTKDVTALIDAQADRASVLREIDGLITRTRTNDLVLLSIAGHGTQEPERVKGSEPDGMENAFLLPGFEPTAAGSQQRILGKEFNHFIKQLELRGAHVVFIADTCHGGGLAREVDPRGAELSYRQVRPYRLTEDTLKPISTVRDAFATELDFDRTEFLAAVDRKTKSPEVSIPGIPGLRGALSYAVARAIEGDADANADGSVTVRELFTTVRQIVYQLSNQRQNIVTVSSRSMDNVVFQLTRGVIMVEATTPPSAPRQERPIRIASLDGNPQQFADLIQPDVPFEVVARGDNPDLFWDPATRDVIDAYGDVVAYRIEKTDLPSVIDRAAAIRELKTIWTKDPQVIRVGPNSSLHHDGSRVQIELDNIKDRALILFNIASNGTVQMLYPMGADLPIIPRANFTYPVLAEGPFGHDQIVAITSDKRMTDLEQILQRFNRSRVARQIIKMIQNNAPRDARIGSTGLYTAP
jgi:hypothetical protein